MLNIVQEGQLFAAVGHHLKFMQPLSTTKKIKAVMCDSVVSSLGGSLKTVLTVQEKNKVGMDMGLPL